MGGNSQLTPAIINIENHNLMLDCGFFISKSSDKVGVKVREIDDAKINCLSK
ncbi:hypothetical protein LDI01_16510 [Lentilactobacillus diolivorans]|uniref:Uncharacterized protein n=1 Tax=Lentilactobacillus diolivorans TaxID=179838 RepID=A0ABQ0XDB0_9LACO|nr:hypothetical protein LDI01_16510 [Lentilactobacillus diolivorans]